MDGLQDRLVKGIGRQGMAVTALYGAEVYPSDNTTCTAADRTAAISADGLRFP